MDDLSRARKHAIDTSLLQTLSTVSKIQAMRVEAEGPQAVDGVEHQDMKLPEAHPHVCLRQVGGG